MKVIFHNLSSEMNSQSMDTKQSMLSCSCSLMTVHQTVHMRQALAVKPLISALKSCSTIVTCMPFSPAVTHLHPIPEEHNA